MGNIGLGKKLKDYEFSMEQEHIAIYQKKFTVTAKNFKEAKQLAVEKFNQEKEESNGDIESWHLAEDSLEPTDRSMDLYYGGNLIGTLYEPEIHEITIKVKAGRITAIKNIPTCLVVRVNDYDTDGVDEKLLHKDENGTYTSNAYETGDEL